jgi:hypothetical protein
MMTEFLIAAVAVAELSTGPAPAGPDYDLGDRVIVVEGDKETSNWAMPELDHEAAAGCPTFVEAELPGIGMLRFGPDCSPPPADQSGFWPRLGK